VLRGKGIFEMNNRVWILLTVLLWLLGLVQHFRSLAATGPN
jgi:hypothetical protein